MTDMTPEEFYKANIGREKEYVRVYVARAIRAGEKIFGSVMTADRDGYEVGSCGMRGDVSPASIGFMDAAAFATETASAEDLMLPAPREDLDAKILDKIRPVSEGQGIQIFRGDTAGTLVTTADHDGFILKTGHGNDEIYLSNFELASRFNYAGRRCETRKERLVTLNDEPPFKGILLDTEMTFSFGENGSSSFPAGSLIYPHPRHGYLVEVISPSPNIGLRLTASHHSIAAERQDRLKALARPVRPR
jgi:hypothetical protein